MLICTSASKQWTNVLTIFLLILKCPSQSLSSDISILPIGDSITIGGEGWNSYRMWLIQTLTQRFPDLHFRSLGQMVNLECNPWTANANRDQPAPCPLASAPGILRCFHFLSFLLFACILVFFFMFIYQNLEGGCLPCPQGSLLSLLLLFAWNCFLLCFSFYQFDSISPGFQAFWRSLGKICRWNCRLGGYLV